MSRELSLSRAEKGTIGPEIQDYLRDEHGVELGEFDAEFLLDFVLERVGPLVYNRALRDAQAVLHRRLDSIGEAIGELEKSTPYDR